MSTIPLAKGERTEERAVCKRCHVVMDDREPMSPTAEFFHPLKHKDGSTSKCRNAGKTFVARPYDDEWESEIEPFMRKRTRRAASRARAR